MHRRELFSLPLVGALGLTSHTGIRAADRKIKERSSHSDLYRLEIENWKEKYSETLPPIDIFTSHPDDNGDYMIVVGFREQSVGYVDFSFTVAMNGISFGKECCQIAITDESWKCCKCKSNNVEALNKEVESFVWPGNVPPPIPLKYRAVDFQVFLIKR